MKESIIVIIAFVFAITYNIALMVSNMASTNGKLEITSTLLTVFNCLKDIYILIVILSNVFL